MDFTKHINTISTPQFILWLIGYRSKFINYDVFKFLKMDKRACCFTFIVCVMSCDCLVLWIGCGISWSHSLTFLVVMGGIMAPFFKPEKNLEFFRLKHGAIDAYLGKLE